MNETEQRIANRLLKSIETWSDNPEELNVRLMAYQDFLNTVNTRLIIEAQFAENQKRA